jgi:hypothetical protein
LPARLAFGLRDDAMPDKHCEICGAEYWARWANTPGVCERCVEVAVVCPDCWKVQLVLPDPAQLSLFKPRALEPFGVRPLSAVIAAHFANHRERNWNHEDYAERLLTTEAAKHPEPAHWPRRASLAERQKYPFH